MCIIWLNRNSDKLVFLHSIGKRGNGVRTGCTQPNSRVTLSLFDSWFHIFNGRMHSLGVPFCSLDIIAFVYYLLAPRAMGCEPSLRTRCTGYAQKSKQLAINYNVLFPLFLPLFLGPFHMGMQIRSISQTWKRIHIYRQVGLMGKPIQVYSRWMYIEECLIISALLCVHLCLIDMHNCCICLMFLQTQMLLIAN